MVFEGFAKGLSFPITADINGLVKAIGQADLELAKVDKAVARGQKVIEGYGNSMQSLGKSMSLQVTAPIVAVGTASVYVAAQFDDSMRQVQATSGATGAEFDALREQARQLGADTAFSASEAAEGMNYLAASGFDANQIMAAMPGMLSLASAGSVELGEAASIASNILNGFGLEAAEAGRVADVLAKSAAATNAGVTDMGEAMSYVAPVAKSTGLSLEEVSAAIGILSNAGIQGSMAGTTLRSAISSLLTPTSEAQEIMDRLGVSVKDSSGKMLPLNEIVGQFEKSGLSAADAMTIFGDRAGPGMLALVQQGQGGLVDLTAELKNSEGAATEMALIMESGPGGAFRTLEGSIEDLAITFGDTLIPAILPFLDLLKDLANWLSSLDKNTLTIIVMVAAFAAAMGPVLIVLGMLISSIGTIITIIPALGAALLFLSANPIVLIIAAVAALVLGLWYLEQKFHWIEVITAAFGAGWSALWDGMVSEVQGAANIIGGIVDWMVSGIKWGINLIIDGVNTMIGGVNYASSVGGLLGEGLNIPEIPRLASGGIVTQPTIAMIGEAGPEAVVPLNRSGASGSAGGRIGGDIVFKDCTFTGNEQQIAQHLHTLITRETRARGA